MNKKLLIAVRGGGDLATGIVHRVYKAGFQTVILETEQPAAIRRQVAFSEAVYEGSACVEGVTAELVTGEISEVLEKGNIPVLIDPEGKAIRELKPDVVVDAIIAKRNLGTTMDMAPLVIGVGPGFTAGEDVHYAIETQRGHNLARILSQGSPVPNTGIPGNIGGYTVERVIHAPVAGVMNNCREIGDFVTAGEEIGRIGDTVVEASITGFIRGLIRDGFEIPREGFKIADIDPREDERENCFTISDKARALGGSVLELVSAYADGVRYE